MRKKSWLPKKMEEFVSCGKLFSKITSKRLRIPRTHAVTGIHRKGREPQRRISMATVKISTWRIRRWRRSSERFGSIIQGCFIYCHQIEPRVQLTCRGREESLLISKIYNTERNSSEKKYSMRGRRDWREAKTSEAKNKFNCFDMAGKDGILYFILQLYARIRSDEKILRKLFSQFPLKVKASTRCLVSRPSVSVRQNSSCNPKSPGEYEIQVWIWEERSMNSEFGCDQRTSGIESHVCFRRLWRSVSHRRMPREPRSLHSQWLTKSQLLELQTKRSFTPSNVDFKCKMTMEKKWKEVIKKAHKTKGKECPLCCIQKYELQEQSQVRTWVRVHPGECSQEQSQVWNIFQKHLSWMVRNLLKPTHHWGAAHKLHRGDRWSRNKGSYGSLLRKKEETSIMVCLESSKPSVENHEYGSQDSNNVETKVKPSSVHRETVAFTMRVKPGLLEKQQRQQRQQQHHVNASENKVKLLKRTESFEGTKITTALPGGQTCRKHPFKALIFKYVYFDTMIDVTVKKRGQRIGM